MEKDKVTSEDVRDARNILDKIQALAWECGRDVRFQELSTALEEMVRQLEGECREAAEIIAARKTS